MTPSLRAKFADAIVRSGLNAGQYRLVVSLSSTELYELNQIMRRTDVSVQAPEQGGRDAQVPYTRG